VIPVLRKNKVAIERAIHSIIRAFKRGGRLFYIGAGTSGRLGVLDASECPPTFSTGPEKVQAIIAGGATALREAVEGAEDDSSSGAEAMGARGIGRRDVVVGIAASGSTPFVVGALDEAKRRDAKTFLLCFSAPRATAHTPLYFNTGPEMITGSTRLKAGTATKLVLNMLTTISMIRLGKVVSNLMVDVKPTNEKLRRRACRIVATLKDCREEDARKRLVRCGWNVKKALR
jgi:N-acetylmuramic acid 6-phosphate etherase